jgi:hypothetical protein
VRVGAAGGYLTAGDPRATGAAVVVAVAVDDDDVAVVVAACKASYSCQQWQQ